MNETEGKYTKWIERIWENSQPHTPIHSNTSTEDVYKNKKNNKLGQWICDTSPSYNRFRKAIFRNYGTQYQKIWTTLLPSAKNHYPSYLQHLIPFYLHKQSLSDFYTSHYRHMLCKGVLILHTTDNTYNKTGTSLYLKPPKNVYGHPETTQESSTKRLLYLMMMLNQRACL